jgi:hypothetical protein
LGAAALYLLLAAAGSASALDPAVLTSTAPDAAPLATTPVPVTLIQAESTETIRSVTIERLNVFDPNVPGEGIWPFRMANKIHILSLEELVRREILLKPGDKYDRLRALESERNLRGFGFFRKAEIKPVPGPGGRTDLLVRTQDAWTTNVQFSAGTEGGDNFFTYGASEDNLLGRGKSVGFLHSQVGPRITNNFTYNDPRLLGSRFRLSPYYSRTNRGDTIGTEVIRPFFSLATPSALGWYWNRSVDESLIKREAEDYSKFILRNRTVSFGYGQKIPSQAALVQRLEGGWYAQRDQFHANSDTVPGTLPHDREMSGPVFGYSLVEPKYIKETFINRMQIVEDFNLGNELSLYGGYMGTATGSDRDRLLYNLSDQQGLFIMPGRFALGQVGVMGRAAGGRLKPENTLLYTNLNLFWKSTWLYPQTWVAHLEGNTGRNLDAENQLILGGNNGLRGYKNFSFTGGRSVLANIENRFFFPGEYFHLVRFGGVLFFDSGSVVPEGSGLSLKRFKSDVGLGLRFSSTRSQSGDVVRMDFAYALNGGPGGSRFVVSIRGRQAFQIFNSSSRTMRGSPRSRLFPRISTDAP